jgi:hypothetical protein
MTNAIPCERKTTPQLDTAVRSLSTLRTVDDGAESRTILADIQYAVRATAEAGLRRVASPQCNLAFQPRVLLSLLVYCYVTGTFSSADIEDLMRRDATFRHLCREEFPAARVLMRFRRENRAAVRDCVYTVLRRQNQRYLRLETGGGSARFSDELMEEADGLILKAMFIDRMEDECA